MNRSYSLSAGIVVVAFFSILISALSLYNQSVRLDESQSIWVATKSATGILEFMAKNDVHPPLYNLLLHFWVQLFGLNVIFTRTLSFIFYLLTLPVVYWLAKEASNRRIAFLTVLLFSLSPFILWFSNETRMYTLFTLATAVNHLFYLRFLRSHGANGKLGYFLSTVVGLYTHYFFIFVIITQVLFVAVREWRQWTRLGTYLAVLATAGLFFLPWVVMVISQGLGAGAQPTLPPPTAFNIFQSFAVFLFGFQSPAIQSIIVSLWPLLMLLFFFLFTQRRKEAAFGIEYFLLVTFFPVILIFFISFFRPIFLTRYLIFVLPTLAFLIAWSLNSFPQGATRVLTVGILIFMSGLLLVQNFSAATPVKEDYRDVADYLSQKAGPSDIIAVSAPFTIYPIEYSYHGDTKIVTIPEWDRYSSGPTPAFSLEAFKNQMNKYKQIYQNVYIVLSYDQGYEPKIRNYLDNNFQLLEDKQFPPGIDARVYQLRYD